MASEMLESTADEFYRSLLADASDNVLVSGAPTEAIESLVAILRDLNNPPAVRLLTSEDALKSAMSDFLVASAAADLIAADQLTLRTTAALPEGFFFLTQNTIISIVAVSPQAAGLVTDASTFVNYISHKYNSVWEEATDFTLRTPPLTRIRESLTNELSPAIRADFDAVLRSLETARGDGDGDSDSLDAVTISLLVAAKNEALLYDLGKWGENIGLTSRTTFSRAKNDLEELGILDTEKVPSDIGRPRQRLVLGDERLHNAEPSQLASLVRDTLSETTT